MEIFVRVDSDFSGKRVLVIGDAMTDEFAYCEYVKRSPEADCDVVRVSRRVVTPGGAANVARCVEALGASATLISGSGSVRKTRIVVDGRQVVRVDEEERLRLPGTTAFSSIEKCDAVIVSDYAKGTVSPLLMRLILDETRERSIPVIVDPKGEDFSVYDGATVLMPNEQEYESARHRGSTPILVTLGERGMRLDWITIPPFRVRVRDVAGAGDSATAAAALMLSRGASLEDAARVAVVCAGLAVAKEGVATVSADELRAGLSRRVGFCNGCFDLLHPGHVHFLWHARQQCDWLVAAVNTDESVRRLKGEGRPAQSLAQRRAALDSLHFVDEIVICDDPPDGAIRTIEPSVIFRGHDQTPPASGEWVRISRLGNFSTTGLL